MLSSAVTLAARATEVAVLQVKKSRQSGKSAKQIATDVVDSVFANGGKIIGVTPATKTAGYATGFYSQSSSFKDVVELQKLDGFNVKTMIDSAKYEVGNRFTNFSYCISAKASFGSMVSSYSFAAYNVGNTLISIFADNPDNRAESRGYSLR